MSYELCEKLRGLEPYEPISGTYRIRLDANESYLELPEETKADMLGRISAAAINRYPDPLASEPCGLFAEYHGIDPALVTAGNGSDELLSLLTQCFLSKGETMTVLDHEFSMYGFYGYVAEAKVNVCPKDSDGTLNVDRLIDSVNSSGSRLLIFSNPCNPTGLGIPREEVLRIVESCPDCLVVADEAYMDFWDQSVITETEKYDNLMVLRTCSKAFRMAGIRCGFAVSNRTVTNALRAVKSPYNVSMLTQSAAAAILSRPDELRAAAAAVLEGRDRLYNALCEIRDRTGKFEMAESVANFVMLRFENGEEKRIFEALKDMSIVVRCFKGSLRVTVGSPEENTEFLRCFESVL